MPKQMRKKRIILLGGAYSQIPIIIEAKRQGYYVITCDYLPENPGHKLADQYFNISTTDYEEILKLAKQEKPELVIAYASDPAAPIAAYVSEKLGLPGNSYESVRLLSEKDIYRKFLLENGFNTPNYVSISESDNLVDIVNKLQLPIIIKPTDSSGSKGVSIVRDLKNLSEAFNHALKFSKNRRVIAEEFVDNEICDVHGDGFVVDGNLVFSLLGDHIYNKLSNPFNPAGTYWPSTHKEELINNITNETARIIKLSGFKKGPVNIEARINSNGKIYVMEIGARNGGHFVPQAIQYASGFDMVKATIDVLNDKPIKVPQNFKKYSAYYAVHSDFGGPLASLSFGDELKGYIKEFHQYISGGDKVNPFLGAGDAIGILLLLFNTREELIHTISTLDQTIKITLT